MGRNAVGMRAIWVKEARRGWVCENRADRLPLFFLSILLVCGSLGRLRHAPCDQGCEDGRAREGASEFNVEVDARPRPRARPSPWAGGLAGRALGLHRRSAARPRIRARSGAAVGGISLALNLTGPPKSAWPARCLQPPQDLAPVSSSRPRSSPMRISFCMKK